MSYVIQNFFYSARNLTITPKVRFLIVLKLIHYLIFFFRFSYYMFFSSRFFPNQPMVLIPFFQVFFVRHPAKTLETLNFKLVGNYLNNTIQSSVYWSFRILSHYLRYETLLTTPVYVSKFLLFNSVFLSIKVINIPLNKKMYDSVFFFLMAHLSQLWYCPMQNISFYLNFFFTPYSFQMFKFFNGYFLRIYNF